MDHLLRRFRRPFAWLILLMVSISGCFPHSCQRVESRELLPVDSLSRAIAEETATDSLQVAWQLTPSSSADVRYPRTLAWHPNGRQLYVSDARAGTVMAVDSQGPASRRVQMPDVAHPYLLGWSADTLVVLDPEAHVLHRVVEYETVESIAIDAGDLLQRAYLYGTQTPEGPVLKAVRKDRDAALVYLADDGRIRRTQRLAGPFWRHTGFLRSWGDSLLSLCGYRPVADVFQNGGRDTLALQGFDSPMLSRSRLFMRGDVSEPPLLSSSATPAGEYLFVLNMRPGWLRVDVYDRAGRLHRILSEPAAIDTRYYPVDIAVHQNGNGEYRIAVAVAEPEPRVDVYEWHPEAARRSSR